MRRRDVVRGTVLAALLALGTWGALAVAQAPGVDDEAGVADEEAFALLDGPGFGGPGMGMGMGHGPGMGMHRGPGRGGFGRGHGRGPGPMAHLEELGLSGQQKDRIEAIRDAQRREGIEVRRDLELAQLDMRKLMRDDAPDRRAIESQIDRIAALRARLQKSRVGTMLEVRDVLTPQQRQKLEQLRERGPDGDARPGGRGPRGPGGARGAGR